jgi:hypothetical protein
MRNSGIRAFTVEPPGEILFDIHRDFVIITFSDSVFERTQNIRQSSFDKRLKGRNGEADNTQIVCLKDLAARRAAKSSAPVAQQDRASVS